jgi:FkbM family methyltransferase
MKMLLNAFFFHDFPNSHIPEILEEIYTKKVYNPFLLGKKDLIIADWGGNIGLTSYFFKDFAKTVYCVEPSKLHIEAIEAMVKQNKIENIVVCPYAISNTNGKERFYHNDNVTMFSLSATVNPQNDFEEVETITPEEFFTRNKIDKIDLLKLDVEGSESKVVCSDSFKKVADKIKVIVGEWHQWDSQNQQAFQHTFEDLGFTFNWLHNTQASVFTAVKL